MQTNNASARTAPPAGESKREIAHRRRSFERRLRAAGIDAETIPDDMDEFRVQLARCICMFVNQWQGCPELVCRRNRGCMAPGNLCGNAERPSADEMERDWPRVRAEVYKAVKELVAEQGGDEG
jgi:hypothetical protein